MKHTLKAENCHKFLLKMPFSRKALIPFLGYRDYTKVQVDFFARYGVKAELTRSVIFENTGLYFILGVLVTLMGAEYGQIYPSAFSLTVEVVSIFLVLFAIFEVDIMVRFPTDRLHWQYWRAVRGSHAW
jgi:hypothetical protein